MNNDTSILIVDDMEENIRVAAAALKKQYPDISFAIDGFSALELIEQKPFDLILLDIMMPDMDGIEVCRRIKQREEYREIPIIFITARTDIDSVSQAFDAGGVDYILKPFNPRELMARVNTHIQLKKHVHHLNDMVRDRTRKIENLNHTLVNALINVNYYNDDETGNHIVRVALYSRELAAEYGLDDALVEEIALYAPIHDLGKVGIPDNILKKAGKLTDEEFQIMKTHPYVGYKMIDHPTVSEVVKNIVLFHHEKWDGSGYPRQLRGEEIPVEARIVALADVYDALRSKRVYKPAFSREKSEGIIIDSSGSHFDPGLVAAYQRCADTFDSIFKEKQDE